MIMVTGASGFIGRSLMRILESQERDVHAYSGRVNDPLRLREELEGVQTVIHLAGSENRGRARLLQHVDVEGTERLLEECRRADVQRLIYVSRLGADPNSIYPLLRAKGETERLIRKKGPAEVTIIRSATLFGRDDRFLNLIAGLAAWSWPFFWLPGGGQVAMQPLWVQDLVRCLVIVLDRPQDYEGKVLEVAGEERLRYEGIVRQVMTATGLSRWPLKLPLKVIRPISALLFGWQRHPPVSRFFMDRFTTPEVAPYDIVLRNFGFQPARIGQKMAHLRSLGLWRLILRL